MKCQLYHTREQVSVSVSRVKPSPLDPATSTLSRSGWSPHIGHSVFLT